MANLHIKADAEVMACLTPRNPYRIADEAALDAIEQGADRVLAEVGVQIKDDPDTLELLRQIGGKVEGEIVRLDGAALRVIIRQHAPRQFLLRGRNPKHDAVIGGPDGRPQFAPIYGAPNVVLDSGQRVTGNREAYRQLVSIVQHSPGLTNSGHMICVLEDVPLRARTWAMLHAHLTCSDKPFMGCIAPPEMTAQFIDYTRQATGRPAEPGTCNLVHLVNCSPPLTYFGFPMKCLRAIAEAGEAAMVSSYMMMGASSPVTVAGSLIQGYAEVLVGLAVAQLWRPGTPVIMGILGWPFDMRMMAPNFGDPASQLVQLHAAQLARRLDIPCRGDGAVTTANMDDALAGGEGARNQFAAIASGADFVLHSAGWLERGRCVSVPKLRRDAAMIAEATGMAAEAAEPLPVDQALLAEIEMRIRVEERAAATPA